MTDPAPNRADDADAMAAASLTAARLLATGSAIDFGSTLTSIGAIGLAIVLAIIGTLTALWAWLLAAVVTLGLLQKYLALRVAFDAGLFRDLAHNVHESQRTAAQTLQRLDISLVALGLRVRKDSLRPLQERFRGARRLMSAQAMCLALQWLLPVVAIILTV